VTADGLGLTWTDTTGVVGQVRPPVRADVLIPALDEAMALPALLMAIPGSGDGWRVGAVVVADNGSRDRTAEVARAAGAVVVCEPRRGYGAACLAGIAHLRRDPPEILAFLDADGSEDPAQLPLVFAPIVRGEADLVFGSRVRGEAEPGSLTAVQRFGNRLATVLLHVLFGGRCTDLGPFRAIRWTTLMRLGMRDRDYGWTVEMQARALRGGWRVVEVPTAWRRRRAGVSKVSGTLRGVWGAGTKILWTIAKVRGGG
jgi:glycosyltransferase involved in cell wall biosynthesis